MAMSSSSTEISDSISSIAVLAARKAGKLILEGSGSIDLDGGIESKIGSRDIVTAVDKSAQDTIKETILSAFPDHSFLGRIMDHTLLVTYIIHTFFNT